MIEAIKKFKIPTILGLSIIILGIIVGVYLVLREQVFLSQAAPDMTPEKIVVTNITDNSAAISWQTNSPTPSFVTFGQNNPTEQTVLDDRDTTGGPKPHFVHYVTLKNLLPKTVYQFKVTSGKLTSDTKKFETATPLINQAGFTPIIGSVLDKGSPLEEGLAYLNLPEAATQSALIKEGGNFLIPLAQMRKTDLSGVYPLAEDIIANLTIQSRQGETQILLKLKANSAPLSPVKLGENIDLTNEVTPSPTPTDTDLKQYDLNNDGEINANDYGTISSCIGKKPSTILPGNLPCAKADINGDGKIDQKDLDLITQKLKKLNS